MSDTFTFVDELGPEKIVEIYDPSTSLKAILVVDNVAAGPAIGGLRMAADVTKEECARLARAMTLKNAMAGLPHGGGKSVIVADPGMAREAKERLVRSFAYAIKDVRDYIAGPDMGTNETFMACIKDIAGRAVGLPRELGGIPLDEIGATGFGLSVALKAAQEFCDLTLRDARVVVQGFGSVGQHAARFLAQEGAHLVGVSDSRGARVNEEGFDLDRLRAFKRTGASVAGFDEGQAIEPAALIGIPCEVWIPAARPDVLREDNVAQMNTKVVAQGANIPASVGAERLLAERGILVIPDFVANAGGVICGAVEYHQGNETQAMATIRDTVDANVRQVFERSAREERLPREIALTIAHERVHRAMSYRQTF